MFEPCPMVAQCIIIHYSALDVCAFALRSLSLFLLCIYIYIISFSQCYMQRFKVHRGLRHTEV